MGEAKQEEAKVEKKSEEKKEEKQEEKKEESSPEEKKEDKAEEKKEEVKPSPPPPTILFVDLHCVGCAKKIERSIIKCRGVEGVVIDMVQNQVTVKGIVDPQALCSRIQKKTMRQAKVLSPLPPAEGDSAKSDVVTSQDSALATVELKVNMHCEACAQQLRRKILKMRGVQEAETDLNSGKVKVTGTMNAEKLVEYVYQRTGKLARIVPQPPKEEEKKDEEGEKKGDAEKPAEEKKEEGNEEKKEEDKGGEKKEEEKSQDNGSKEEKATEGGGGSEEKEGDLITTTNSNIVDEDMAKKMMYWTPVYMIERLPPPQLFSDENPNACCIS